MNFTKIFKGNFFLRVNINSPQWIVPTYTGHYHREFFYSYLIKAHCILLTIRFYLFFCSIKVMLSVALLASFAIQFVVGHEIFFGPVKKWISKPAHTDRWDYICRVVFTTFTVIIAIGMPHLGMVMRMTEIVYSRAIYPSFSLSLSLINL